MRGLLTGLVLLAACAPAPEVRFQAGELSVAVGADGQLTSLRLGDADMLAPGQPAPILSLRVAGHLLAPTSADWNTSTRTLRLRYEQDLEAELRIESAASHASLEVTAVSDTGRVELVLWGPYPTVLDETIGETVGVVQGRGMAIGLQALNPRTLGGYPWNENDAMPEIDIFESGDYSDLSPDGKRAVLYRVEAAKPDTFGSTLQAYTRNRSRARTISNLEYERYLAPAIHDGGVVGSRIALFGSPALYALETIGAIELAEGLPHPILDGVWAKQSPRRAQAYVIMPFSELTAQAALDIVERAGMQILYHPDPFSSWGQFTLRPDDFPNGVQGLRGIADQAAARGMRVGGHSLSNFIQPHDAYVSPVPDPRLARVGVGTLSADVSPGQSEIQVASPELFRAGLEGTLHTVIIQDELVQYTSVSETPPWRLLGVTRGAFGTRPASHPSGSAAALLADHGYRVFLTDPDLTLEMARNLAGVFEESGMRHISFDGLEGNRSTGAGNYGEILFTQAWFDALSPAAREDLIVTASRTSHYFWHLYTRMNWGEPWYAGFRESQTEYRMKNQAYFKRNFMPGMLGWFSLREETSLEDIEWMLARSAAYDAGYALSTSMEALSGNGRSGEMLDAMARWERARLGGAFSPEQKRRMEDVSGEFHLEESEGSWTLYPIATWRFLYAAGDRQPGEPATESFSFESRVTRQPLAFTIVASEGALEGVALGLDTAGESVVSATIPEGHALYYRGGPLATLYDPSWHAVGTVPLIESTWMTNTGPHTLVFRAASGSARIELRLTGEAERVTP